MFIEFDASLHWFSRWILKQQVYNLEVNKSHNGGEFPGQHPSYRDPRKLALGCKHYKRNCKLFAACCNQLYTCIRCHDEVADHSLDRYSHITSNTCCYSLKFLGFLSPHHIFAASKIYAENLSQK